MCHFSLSHHNKVTQSIKKQAAKCFPLTSITSNANRTRKIPYIRVLQATEQLPMRFLQENSSLRKFYFPVRGKSLKLPVYFPSISSVKTGLSPSDYYQILKAVGQQHFLVSAFDVDKSYQRENFISMLKANQKEDGPIILMDSGNYESYWIRDKSWSISDFNEILKEDVCDLAFCFDNQFPPESTTENAKAVADSTQNSQSISNKASIIPIVHCKKEYLSETISELYKQTSFAMVSIPERILGDGVLERVATVTILRQELNKLDNYVYIHLLGTGNPFSLLLFSLAGADSFDGLEWCQTTVNVQTSLLFHFQQRELVADNCSFCENSELDYNLKTLGHNLLFYKNWMAKIQDALENGTEQELLQQYFDSTFVNQLSKIWA